MMATQPVISVTCAVSNPLAMAQNRKRENRKDIQACIRALNYALEGRPDPGVRALLLNALLAAEQAMNALLKG